jgi:ketosteroid isomerase-like protein
MSHVEEFRDLLRGLYDSFGSGDPSAWTDHLAPDVLGIGSDPGEWWEGRDVVSAIGAKQVKEMSDAGISVTGGDARIVEHGDVLWAADRPVLRLVDGSEVPMRFTVVAEHHEGTLRLTQFHLSVGAANEEVVGQDLPMT